MEPSFRPHPGAPGSQAPWAANIPAQPPTAFAPASKRFECSVPGCGRHFTRKEHLTRHLKSHSSHFQHQCPICGRRYARSDVLKRHIEFHPQLSRSQKLVACVSCRERKLKCDEDTPCQSCVRNRNDCVRVTPSPDAGAGNATANADADWHVDLDVGMTNANLVSENESSDTHLLDLSVVTSAWSTGSSAQQQPWAHGQQPQYDWSLSSLPSLPSPKSALDLSLPHASAGVSSNRGSPAVGGGQYPSGVDLVPLSNAWHQATDDGVADGPSTMVTESSESFFATTAVETGRSNAASSIASLGTDHGFSVVPSNAATSLTSASPRTDPGRENRALHNLVHHDPAMLRDLVHVFFAEIHPHWPILHVPTFDIKIASDPLLGAILILSSWVVGRQDHLELAPIVFDEVTGATGPESVPSLHSLQALLLCVVYAVCCRSEESMLAKAVRLNAVLVSTCRCLDIFSGHHVLPDRMEECAFTLWLAKEQLHRLAFSVLRLDTYLSILLDHPPSVRYQEMCIPLPKSSQLWMATSEEERRKLQWEEPAGREKALFSSLIRDALVDAGDKPGLNCLPYRLSAVDYHLGLCALQVGIWEAAREAHSAASDEIVTKLSPGDPIVLWRAHVNSWRTKMVEECELGEQYVSATRGAAAGPREPDFVLVPLTLIMWHISNIKMHAPLTLLRLHGSLMQGYTGLNPAAAAAMAAVQKPKARLRRWMASQCPRTAVWSASQIARLLTGDGAASEGGDNVGGSSAGLEAGLSGPGTAANTATLGPPPRRLLLNPLAVPGLLMSAIVTCSYASQTSACPNCSPAAGSCATFDLFTATDADPRLVRWKERGEGCAVWGPSGICVCHCRLAALGEWFSTVLARDHGAKGEFESFFEGLV